MLTFKKSLIVSLPFSIGWNQKLRLKPYLMIFEHLEEEQRCCKKRTFIRRQRREPHKKSQPSVLL